ncbi:FAD-dependent oxidoreductase [Lichenihabitans sp. PAMC28606]|uniref:FAD-dependent oxidoreductase n=1 Tax=Lichenihabitans sp. PAMC28606 TaxID=2880932 RepID=UPI001D0B1328|nr:FAD-dependent oxidoreductase [Lichenihabitans sp. PAMC28606]UDL94993.1 FAD-dependent oxidoreductase [Lichenihabitans sp. PAMC28606]
MTDAPRPTILTPDLCIIGGGVAGSAMALAAAAIGLSCVVVDAAPRLGRGQAADLALDMLIQSARTALPHVGADDRSFAMLRDRIGRAVAAASANHSAERLRSLSVTLIQATARFADPDTIAAGDIRIKPRRIVIATGGKPTVPRLDALDLIRFWSTDTIAALATLPPRLSILGQEPLAYELAQAYRRLGSEVTLLRTGGHRLNVDGEILVAIDSSLHRDGVAIVDTEVRGVRPNRDGVDIVLADDAGTVVTASHLLVAQGRKPFTESLGLDRGEVRCVDGVPETRLDFRTSNRRVYAIGDVAGAQMSAATLIPIQVGLVLRSAFFRQPVRLKPQLVPRVLRTVPALAMVGHSEAEARRLHRDVTIHRAALADNERAIARGVTAGHTTIVATPRGEVLGASILGPRAEDLIVPWAIAIEHGISLGDMAVLALPQPSLSDTSRRAALGFVAAQLRRPWVKRAMGVLKLLG